MNVTATEVDTQAKDVEARNLDLYYGDFLAVKDVNVRVPPQKITALIGSSGCGKSTFLRAINRMHELIPGAYVEGTIIVAGEDIYRPDVDATWIHCDGAPGAPDGRAVLGARPDLDDRRRATDGRAEAQLHDRHRHPQHAAGDPRE
jgi:ABC-type cobalamin/Fe3+-siderophores transport system ATPase subunit